MQCRSVVPTYLVSEIIVECPFIGEDPRQLGASAVGTRTTGILSDGMDANKGSGKEEINTQICVWMSWWLTDPLSEFRFGPVSSHGGGDLLARLG